MGEDLRQLLAAIESWNHGSESDVPVPDDKRPWGGGAPFGRDVSEILGREVSNGMAHTMIGEMTPFLKALLESEEAQAFAERYDP